MLMFTKYPQQISEMMRGLFPEVDVNDISLDRSGHADFTLKIFRLLKQGKRGEEILNRIKGAISPAAFIESVSLENAYINFTVKSEYLARAIMDEISTKGTFPDTFQDPERISVEHTSTNPTGPIHIGRIRNSILGDSMARILERYGYRVTTQYFVNDSGRQVASLCTGARKYCSDDSLTPDTLLNAYRKIHSDIEEHPELEQEVQSVMQSYERGDKDTVDYIRKICSVILGGINQSLLSIDIKIDDYTWESNFIRTGETAKILNDLGDSVHDENGAKYILKDERKIFLSRSDGTSLYFLRDIAYHLYKFQNFDWVIDVLGENHKDHGNQLSYVFSNLMEVRGKLQFMFYSYVSLESGSMSTRGGNTVTLDELLKKAGEESYRIVKEKRSELEEDQMRSIADAVASSAIRFSIVRLNANKQMVFRWSEALSFEGDSAPYIMYSYARTSSILRKTGNISRKPEWNNLEIAERGLLFKIYSYPYAIEDSVRGLKPDSVATYLLELTRSYNDFYSECPVLSAEEGKRERRIEILKMYRNVVKNATDLLGIKILEEM